MFWKIYKRVPSGNFTFISILYIYRIYYFLLRHILNPILSPLLRKQKYIRYIDELLSVYMKDCPLVTWPLHSFSIFIKGFLTFFIHIFLCFEVSLIYYRRQFKVVRNFRKISVSLAFLRNATQKNFRYLIFPWFFF